MTLTITPTVAISLMTFTTSRSRVFRESNIGTELPERLRGEVRYRSCFLSVRAQREELANRRRASPLVAEGEALLFGYAALAQIWRKRSVFTLRLPVGS
jgi:hypothetical protein